MRKIIKYKYYFFLFLIIFILSCIFILKYSFDHKKIDNISIINFNPYSFFQKIEENTTYNFFKDKVSYIKKEEKSILIGKNTKELSNGYFDIKFIFYDNSMNIYINKLTKDEISTEYISQEYIDELTEFLFLILNCDDTVNEIKNNIEKEYLKLRNNLECTNEITNLRIIDTDKYIVNFSIEKNMLKIEIKV